jgi:hypothetical protein
LFCRAQAVLHNIQLRLSFLFSEGKLLPGGKVVLTKKNKNDTIAKGSHPARTMAAKSSWVLVLRSKLHGLAEEKKTQKDLLVLFTEFTGTF